MTYKPNGIPLTPYEDELLTILIEECAEVIQAATKLQRFGKETHPDTGVNNSTSLSLEIGNLMHMILTIAGIGIIDIETVYDGILRKRERLAHFMQTKP